jgi:hypothetical protein
MQSTFQNRQLQCMEMVSIEFLMLFWEKNYFLFSLILFMIEKKNDKIEKCVAHTYNFFCCILSHDQAPPSFLGVIKSLPKV